MGCSLEGHKWDMTEATQHSLHAVEHTSYSRFWNSRPCVNWPHLVLLNFTHFVLLNLTHCQQRPFASVRILICLEILIFVSFVYPLLFSIPSTPSKMVFSRSTLSLGHTSSTKLFLNHPAAAAAKSLQSCPTLCDPIDGSPPGSPVPGILQARTLEWVAISLSNA